MEFFMYQQIFTAVLGERGRMMNIWFGIEKNLKENYAILLQTS